MSKKDRLSGKRAVWFALLSTPVLVIAAMMLVGVTAGSAGPSVTSRTATPAQATTGVSSQITALGAGTQTLAELKAYWTPERMAAAQPYPIAHDITSSKSEGSVESMPTSAGSLNVIKMNADGSVSTASEPAPNAAQALTEPFHALIPYTQWQYFAKYPPNSPGGGTNVVAAAQHKMFFSQDDDGNGTASSFVCSSSTIGVDAAWTAGHCISNGLNGAGFNGGVSFNVLHCPSFDNGAPMPGVGCWGASEIWWSNNWFATGDFDYDFGATDTADTGTENAVPIGTFTGALGLAYVGVAEGTTEAFNANFVSFGYPQGAPFNGNKIQVCTSSIGYVDAATGGGQDSKAIGCDMTGGSSGGPWILSMGRGGGQPGGGGSVPSCCNFVFGHNDWRHTAEPDELNSPPYNCLALGLYRAVNDLTPIACP
jgi:hypothetical protein